MFLSCLDSIVPMEDSIGSMAYFASLVVSSADSMAFPGLLADSAGSVVVLGLNLSLCFDDPCYVFQSSSKNQMGRYLNHC